MQPHDEEQQRRDDERPDFGWPSDRGRDGLCEDEPSGSGPEGEQEITCDRLMAIDEKLQEIVAASATIPTWHDAWVHSKREWKTTPDGEPDFEARLRERLAVWKVVRDSKAVPEDAGFFLVAYEVQCLTVLHISKTMEEIDRRIDAVWQAFGFEEWRSRSRRDSKDFLAFRERCPLDWDRLYFEMLQRHEEPDIARLYRTDQEGFHERLGSGCTYFYPPPPTEDGPAETEPEWLRDFYRDVHQSKCLKLLTGQGATAQFGFKERENHFDIAVGFVPAPVVGGPLDGKVMHPHFWLDIQKLRAIFDKVHVYGWDPFDAAATSLGPHVWVIGVYRGNPVVFQVFTVPPA